MSRAAAALASISYRPIQRWRLGPLSLSPHGVGTAGGFALGVALMARAAERRGVARTEIYNATTWGAIGAIVGARGFYVLAHLSDFRSLADMLAIWRGGLTMFGGFAGGIALGMWYMYRRDLPLRPMMDAAAPGFVAGIMVGRIGDLLIADHLGNPTRFFLGYKIPPGAELAPGFGPPTYVPGVVVHQTALYDLIGALLLAGVLALIARRKLKPGTLFCAFAVWYGIQRFLIDFTRNRDLIESHFLGLSGSQWAGLLFSAAGAAAYLRYVRNAPDEGVPAPVFEAPAAEEPIHAKEPPAPEPEPEPELAPPAEDPMAILSAVAAEVAEETLLDAARDEPPAPTTEPAALQEAPAEVPAPPADGPVPPDEGPPPPMEEGPAS